MPRIRTIKPELFGSPQVMNLSHSARLLFIGLITQADDEGRGIADLRKLKSAIFGGDDDVTTARVLEMLAEIEGQSLAVTYDANGHGRVYALPSWRSHQYIEKAKKSAYPAPSPLNPHSIPSDSPPVPHGSEGSEGSEGKDLTRAGASPAELPAARGARGREQLKKRPTDPDEIERRRRDVAGIAARLAAGAKP